MFYIILSYLVGPLPEFNVVGTLPDPNIARIYSYMQQVDIYTKIVIASVPPSTLQYVAPLRDSNTNQGTRRCQF